MLLTWILFVVREQLSAFFGFDMTPKKEYINTSIEYILQGRL